MSIIHPVPNAIDHIQDRTQKLLNFNEIRVMELLEIVQYGLGYMGLAFIIGVSLDYLFPRFDEEQDTHQVLIEIILQIILLLIGAFYIRKIVKIMPFLFVVNFDIDGDGRIPKYRPYESTEFEGELMMGLVFVASQRNLLNKIDLISTRLYAYLKTTNIGMFI